MTDEEKISVEKIEDEKELLFDKVCYGDRMEIPVELENEGDGLLEFEISIN